MKELYYETLKVLCYESFQRAFILAFFSIGTLMLIWRSMLFVAPKKSIKESVFGEDGVLQADERLELFKFILACCSFSFLIGFSALALIKGLEASVWVTSLLYISLLLICTFSIYDMDKNKLLDVINKFK